MVMEPTLNQGAKNGFSPRPPAPEAHMTSSLVTSVTGSPAAVEPTVTKESELQANPDAKPQAPESLPDPTQICSTACVARAGVEDNGDAVPAAVLAQRAQWLAVYTRAIGDAITEAHFNDLDLATLATEVCGTTKNKKGEVVPRKLPSTGYVAARRLGVAWLGKSAIPENIYVSDRVYRMGQECAMRELRLAVYRRKVITVLLKSWPKNPQKRSKEEWQSLWDEAHKQGLKNLTRAEIHNRTRSICAFVKKRERLPDNSVDLEEFSPPKAANQILLAAGDKQNVLLSRPTKDKGVLRVQLPLTPTPASPSDWSWVVIPFTIGPHVPEHAELHKPTLRLKAKAKNSRKSTQVGTESAADQVQIFIDLPFSRVIPPVKAKKQKGLGRPGPKHIKAVAFDKGVNTLLAGVSGTTDIGTSGKKAVIRTNGKPVYYSGAGIEDKKHRLRRHGEELNAITAQHKALLYSTPTPQALPQETLNRLMTVTERKNWVNSKRSNLGHDEAWGAARWALDYALSERATVIYLEDTGTLQAGGLGTKQNVRMSNAVWGITIAALEHLAAQEGIEVVYVPPENTSAWCSRCLAVQKHVLAPDRLTEPGHAWAYCEACKHSADRDHPAAERVLTRGLAAQNYTKMVGKTNVGKIKVIIDVVIRVTRGKRDKNRTEHYSKKPTPATDRARNNKAAKSRDKQGPTPKSKGSPARKRRTHKLNLQDYTAQKRQEVRKSKGQRSKTQKNPKTGGQRLTRTVSATSNTQVQRPAEANCSLIPPIGVGRQVGSTTTIANVSPKRVRRVDKVKKHRRRVQGRGFHPMNHPSWVG